MAEPELVLGEELVGARWSFAKRFRRIWLESKVKLDLILVAEDLELTRSASSWGLVAMVVVKFGGFMGAWRGLRIPINR